MSSELIAQTVDAFRRVVSNGGTIPSGMQLEYMRNPGLWKVIEKEGSITAFGSSMNYRLVPVSQPVDLAMRCKCGDKVRCIDNNGVDWILKVGEVYTVSAIKVSNGQAFLSVRDAQIRETSGWDFSRFENVTNATPEVTSIRFTVSVVGAQESVFINDTQTKKMIKYDTGELSAIDDCHRMNSGDLALWNARWIDRFSISPDLRGVLDVFRPGLVCPIEDISDIAELSELWNSQPDRSNTLAWKPIGVATSVDPPFIRVVDPVPSSPPRFEVDIAGPGRLLFIHDWLLKKIAVYGRGEISVHEDCLRLNRGEVPMSEYEWVDRYSVLKEPCGVLDIHRPGMYLIRCDLNWAADTADIFNRGEFSTDGHDWQPLTHTVPLEAADVPPGSVIRNKKWQPHHYEPVYPLPSKGMLVHGCGSHSSTITFKELSERNYLILRPGQSEWQPCSKQVSQ